MHEMQVKGKLVLCKHVLVVRFPTLVSYVGSSGFPVGTSGNSTFPVTQSHTNHHRYHHIFFTTSKIPTRIDKK